MPTDTITETIASIEDRFFEGLKAVQDPTVEAVRTAAELTARLPLPEQASALVAKLPSVDAIVQHNFAFAQRLLDVQRDFAVRLTTVSEPAPAPAKAKKSAA